MFRFPSEKQAPETTQGDSDAELTKAVDFATLISQSSLNAPGVQDHRLTGRKEIAARLAERAEAFGVKVPLDRSTPGVDNLGPAFECRVADQLELRGYTFEAELHYRRIHDPAAHRLALMLDAKGFHRESWQWYLRMARLNDINSLFRLATICWTRDDHDWAVRLAKHAVAQLAPDAYHTLTTSIVNLAHRMSVKSVLNVQTNGDADYALGSVLLVLAHRPDLARLAYFSAATRGHSLAAVSLLDFARRPMIKKVGNWRLSTMLQDGLGDELEKRPSTMNQCGNFDRLLRLLKNDVQDETFEGLMQAIRARTDHREDAIERILFTTRLITVLGGYGQFGCNTRAFRYLDVAADVVCGKVHHRLAKGTVGDAVSLINMIRDWSTRELNNYRRSEQRYPDARLEKRNKAVAAPSAIARLWREYFNLPPERREVLILQLAGLHSSEVANALGYRQVDIARMFADAMTRLQEAQLGEQIPIGKLLGAEVDSCFSARVLELIAPLPAWHDTKPAPPPGSRLDPTHGSSRAGHRRER